MKFNWKGLKSNSFASGEIEADNKDEAIFKLKKDGIIITEINGGDDSKKDKKQKTKNTFFSRKIKVKEDEDMLGN